MGIIPSRAPSTAETLPAEEREEKVITSIFSSCVYLGLAYVVSLPYSLEFKVYCFLGLDCEFKQEKET